METSLPHVWVQRAALVTVDGNDGLLIKRKNTLPYRAGRLLVQESFKKLEIQQKCDWKPRDAV